MSATNDPIISAAMTVLDEILAELRPTIEGATPEALNWRPAGDDTNSVAVLAVHAMSSTRSWLSVAVGAPLPDRDRPAEFAARAQDAQALLAFVSERAEECATLLSNADVPDWGITRQTHARPRAGASEQVSAAWALIHSIEHMREHVGQMALTRQLWEMRA